jgi:DNA-binding NtrC family response regulator
MSCCAKAEVVLFNCRPDDVAVVEEASAAGGPQPRVVDSAVEVAHRAVACRAVAVFIGIGRRSLKNLDVIPLIHTAHEGLPVIVIADEDSLDLERRARSRSIFYYFVRPLNPREVAAVLRNALRRART